MSLVICIRCGHPFTEHEDSGCVDLLDLGDDGYPETCPCKKTADEVLRQVVPQIERISCVDDLAGMIDYEIVAEIERLTAERDGYALLVGELRAALAWYADERNYDAGPVASINRYDRWPVVQDAGERARAILAAEPEARASALIQAARVMERAIQTWLDDPTVDATQEETDLLGEAYGYWVNAVAGTAGPLRNESAS